MGEADTDKRKWMVLAVIVIKMIMDGLDGSMLSIALPSISESLSVSTGAIVWAVSAYSITTSTAVLFFGRLGDMVGKTRFYIIGIAIYALSTLVSGMANSLPMLVAARVVQAIGASCTMANSQGLITMVFPEHQRGRALGIYGGAMSLGALAGPTLGGFIVAYMDWQYIFWTKLPFAFLAFVLGLKFFPKDVPAKDQKMDYPGALLYAVAIVPLLTSLQQGYAAGYTSMVTISGIGISVISFTAFFTLQRKKTMPLLDLSIYKNRLYSIGVLTAFILSFLHSFQSIIIPFYMQGVLGTPANIAGMYMSISPVITVLITPVSGMLSDKVGGEKLGFVGQGIILTGMILMATLTKNSQVFTMVIYFSIINFGFALFQAPNNAQIMSNVAKDKLGIGGSASFAVRNIGSSIGVALTTGILYGGMSKHLGYHVTGYVRDSGMDDAFMYGMRNTFIVSCAFCLVGVVVSIYGAIAASKGKKTDVGVEA
jgi:EmrB/QacA subfamily drug resistance transporter